MLFTDLLYINTKDTHTVVDRHPFVSKIRKSKEAGDLYINFNKICIYHLENVYNISNIDDKLYRRINKNDINFPDSDNLKELLERCERYPLEHIYMFYLGLLFGGNMLSKMLPQHLQFLKFEEPKERIDILKKYLNDNVENTKEFINKVNVSYSIIKNVFDDLNVLCI